MRDFEIRRFDDFDCIRFTLLYPRNLVPGKSRHVKNMNFSVTNVTHNQYESLMQEALQRAKVAFDKELTDLGVS